MKIAIFHNEDIHYEMLGYLIDYFQTYNITVHFYSFFNNFPIGKTYSNWYNSFFNQYKINWKTTSSLDENINYDVVILVTDDNPSYSQIKDKYKDKTISIEHWCYDRNNQARIKIGTRLYQNRPQLPFALPCYNIISEQDKFELIQRQDKIKVVFVGRFNFPASFTFSFFNNIDDIEFHLIMWDIKNCLDYLKPPSNFFVHNQIDTEEMMDIMKSAHYAFFNPTYMHGYSSNKLSATFHLAISTLVKPIIPEYWNNIYKLDSNLVVQYDDYHYLQPDKQLNLTKEEYIRSLPFLSQYRKTNIAHRNMVFDQAIKSITGTTLPPSNSTWISNLFNRLILNYPKTIIGVESFFDTEIVNDFSCIHNINTTSTETIDNYKLYNYNGDTVQILQNVLDSLKEPVVIVIDENIGGQSFYSSVFQVLSSHKKPDIILLNFASENIDISIDKNLYVYRFSNQPITLLIPKSEEIEYNLFQVCIPPFNHNNIPERVIEKIKVNSNGYNYTLYTGDMVSNIMDTTNSIIKHKYNSCLKSQHKKDIFEFVVLYNNGGIYVDIDTEPLVPFENFIKRTELNPTFVAVISVTEKERGNNGLAIGLVACSKYNKIISLILNEIMYSNFELVINEEYGLFCKMVGFVLTKFLGVERLETGFYKVGGERILILDETWNQGDYNSCKIVYDNEILANTRYSDYPWNL